MEEVCQTMNLKTYKLHHTEANYCRLLYLPSGITFIFFRPLTGVEGLEAIVSLSTDPSLRNEPLVTEERYEKILGYG